MLIRTYTLTHAHTRSHTNTHKHTQAGIKALQYIVIGRGGTINRHDLFFEGIKDTLQLRKSTERKAEEEREGDREREVRDRVTEDEEVKRERKREGRENVKGER